MKFKVGDKVVFTHYENEDEWEKVYGADVGDVVDVVEVDDYDAYKTYRVITKTKDSLFVHEYQLKPYNEDSSNEDQDVVNHPKHYTSDPSGIECIQVTRHRNFNIGNAMKPVKSDGGSSSYYFSPLPQHIIDQIVETGGIEIKDIVRYCFDNDADCKDIIKALKRIRECKKGGGKEGVDIMYDATKIKFFADELYKEEKANG